MKVSACKFRRRWRAAQCRRDPEEREAKLAYLVEMFQAQPVYRGPAPSPVAYRLSTGDVFCVKHTYDSPRAAWQALLELRARPGHRECAWYECPTCGRYHLSSRFDHPSSVTEAPEEGA